MFVLDIEFILQQLSEQIMYLSLERPIVVGYFFDGPFRVD